MANILGVTDQLLYATMRTAERGSPGRHGPRAASSPSRCATTCCSAQAIRSACSRPGCLAPLRRARHRRARARAVTTSRSPRSTRTSRSPGGVLRDTQSAYDDVITGDLRTVPIPQRAYDVVYCALLLERVQHVELVLDRLTSALKPGGLLLVRTGDRYSAAALLDRMLPRAIRRAVWCAVPARRPRPVQPGVREGGLRRGHRRLRADARARHRRARQRPRPSRPPGRAIIVGANHLRGHRPAERRPLRRRAR